MTWVTDYFDSFTYGTSTSSVGAGVNRFYDKRFLRMLTKELRLIKYGQKRPLPEGNGKIIDFFRWLTLAQGSRTLTEGINPNASQVTMQKVTATLVEYGGFAQPSSLIKQAHIDTNLTGLVDIMAFDGALHLDTACHKEVCSNGCYPIRADLDSTKVFSGTISTATSTTEVRCASLETNTNYGDTNDDLNQSIIVFTGGANKGLSRQVTDYVASGGVMTLSPALENTPTTSDTFVVTSADAIASGDNLSYANIKKARTILKKNQARPYDGQYYIGVIDVDLAGLLMDDSDWKNVNTYKDQTQGIFEGEIGKFGGVRFIEETNPFRFPITTIGTAGTSYGPGASGGNWQEATSTASAAVVCPALVFGRDAFGVTTFSKKSGQAANPSVIIKTPGPNDTSNPLNRYGTVGWEIEAAYKGLQALHMVNIWCYSPV